MILNRLSKLNPYIVFTFSVKVASPHLRDQRQNSHQPVALNTVFMTFNQVPTPPHHSPTLTIFKCMASFSSKCRHSTVLIHTHTPLTRTRAHTTACAHAAIPPHHPRKKKRKMAKNIYSLHCARKEIKNAQKYPVNTLEVVFYLRQHQSRWKFPFDQTLDGMTLAC